MTLVAGVDTSTQSCTVVVRDTTSGDIVRSASAPHPPTTPPVSEQHPYAWWSALRTAAAEAGLADISAINVTGQAHGLTMLSSSGAPIRPAKLWNDTTSAPQAEELVARLGPGEWARRTGSVPVSAFTISKLAWTAQNDPDALRDTHSLLMPADYLTHRLTGRATSDRSNASHTGYFSPARSAWDTALLDLVDDTIDWQALLPTVLGPQDGAGLATVDAATDIGAPPGVPCGPGSADNMAAALGLGIVPGDVVLSLGTSGCAYALHDRAVADPTGAVNGNADASGRFLPVVCTLNAAKVTDTFARLLGVDHATMAGLALAAPARPDRPVLAAFLDGERVPNRPRATGLLSGLRTDTAREDLARAAFEGVLAGLVAGIGALERCGVATGGRLVLTGGAAQSPAYRQLAADLTGRPVSIPLTSEAAAQGSAIQAAAALTGEPVERIARRWAPDCRVVAEPRPGSEPGPFLERYRALSGWDAPARDTTPGNGDALAAQ